MAISKTNALRLASDAIHDGAVAMRGPLAKNEEGQFLVGDRSLTQWLEQHQGQELVIILAPIKARADQTLRQCAVCGRDYEGDECPHCARARIRLRGA